MSLFLLFKRRGNTDKAIGSIEIDVFSEETITLDNEVTDNPVESGESVTDHVYNRPVVVRVRGTVANATNGFGLSGFGLAGDRRQDAYEKLRELHRLRETVDVVTGLEVFTGMQLKTLEIPRDILNSAGLTFTAEFWQIRIVDSQRVDIGITAAPEAEDIAASENNAGRQSSPAATTEDAARAESILIRLGRAVQEVLQ